MVSISILLASNYSNSIFINFLSSHTDEINDKLSIFDYELIKASLISYVAQVGLTTANFDDVQNRRL